MRLCEAAEDHMPEFDDDYDDDAAYDNLPSSAAIRRLRPQIAAAAQQVYDHWHQDDDDELNGGGICHLIADATANLLSEAGIPVWTETASDVQHVYCVAQCQDGVFEVDIPYRMYEYGSMFTWTKIPDVQFDASDVVISMLDSNPSRIGIYVSHME